MTDFSGGASFTSACRLSGKSLLDIEATRNPILQPLSITSPWNTPLGAGATFAGWADPTTKSMQQVGLTGVTPWVHNLPARSFAKAGACDPVVTWTSTSGRPNQAWPNGGNWWDQPAIWQMKTPGNIDLSGPDHNVTIISEDGTHFYDLFFVEADAATQGFKCARVTYHDIRADAGFSASPAMAEGIRAAGCPWIAGTIRPEEMAAGKIPHAIYMIPALSQLKAAATQVEQYVWPANGADGNSVTAYKGAIPIGALFAIPFTVNLASLGLSPQGLILATAFQQYGGYVVDTAGAGTNVVAGAIGLTAADYSALLADVVKIRDQLRMVTNNSAANPGGPGERVAPWVLN